MQFGHRAAALYRTRDGGKTWTRLTQGLPDDPIGRCGLAVSRQATRASLYAVVQTDKTAHLPAVRSGRRGRTADVEHGRHLPLRRPRRDLGQAQRPVSAAASTSARSASTRNDPQRVYVLGIPLLRVRTTAARRFRNDGLDRRSTPITTPCGSTPPTRDHLILGNDGGVYPPAIAAHLEHVKNLPVAQFYARGRRQAQAVPRLRRPAGQRHLGRAERNARPGRHHAADWSRLPAGDGFPLPGRPGRRRHRLRRGAVRHVCGASTSHRRAGDDQAAIPAARAPEYRFNWSTPLLLSPHDAHTLYFGGNVLFRSTNRGDRWESSAPT